MIRAIHYATGGAIEIRLKGGVITAIEAVPEGGADAPEELPIAAPGLVDLQINGYQGRDFNQLPLSAASVSDSPAGTRPGPRAAARADALRLPA